ncbi:MAG: hypothetical protein K8I00_09125, partial [Candidatus Omnitrophica bacterium]|nr:hypothetical protein [Candidatus Omnitrophota bacterium]
MAAGRTVAVSINGGAIVDTDDTDGSGNYSISGMDIDAGDVITVFIDGEAEKAVVVTRGSGLDMTINLYEDYLITRADDGGALTNANLDTANNVGGGGDADINAIYTMSGTALTVVSGVELLVWTGDEFAPGDTVTAGNLDINGTFTMAANNVNISGGWDATDGQFSGSGGTVTFNASTGATFDIISNSGTFGEIDINTTGGSVIELEDAMIVGGTLTITQGTLDVKSGENNSLTVGGSWDNSGSFEARAGTVTLTGTQALDITSGGDNFYNLTFNGSGSWELQDALDVNGALTIAQGTLDVNAAGSYMINVGGDWTNSGSFLARSGTVAFDATSGSPTITSGGAAFTNIELTDGGNDITFTLESNLDINGTL